MAEKLIPGIPHATRISILQQTDGESQTVGIKEPEPDQSVLESVLNSDKSRNELVHMVNGKRAIDASVGRND